MQAGAQRTIAKLLSKRLGTRSGRPIPSVVKTARDDSNLDKKITKNIDPCSRRHAFPDRDSRWLALHSVHQYVQVAVTSQSSHRLKDNKVI